MNYNINMNSNLFERIFGEWVDNLYNNNKKNIIIGMKLGKTELQRFPTLLTVVHKAILEPTACDGKFRVICDIVL